MDGALADLQDEAACLRRFEELLRQRARRANSTEPGGGAVEGKGDEEDDGGSHTVFEVGPDADPEDMDEEVDVQPEDEDGRKI